MKYTRQLYLDNDGVNAHFDQHYMNIFGHHHKSVSDNEMWKNINGVEDWWRTMIKFDHFDELWNSLKKYNPIILTGCPISNFEKASADKVIWAKEHFGDDVRIITCLSKDKQKFMKNKGDILVDDMSKNCKRWEEAGGVAIRFFPEKYKEVISQVDELMNETL